MGSAAAPGQLGQGAEHGAPPHCPGSHAEELVEMPSIFPCWACLRGSEWVAGKTIVTRLENRTEYPQVTEGSEERTRKKRRGLGSKTRVLHVGKNSQGRKKGA